MAEKQKTMLFFCNIPVVRGGLLKVFDYMNYSKQIKNIKPILCISQKSKFELIEKIIPEGIKVINSPIPADIYFISGKDWEVLDSAGIDISNKPVINIIQQIKHSNPRDHRHGYFSRPAMRVFVSHQVASAITRVCDVQGPLITIPLGSDVHSCMALKNQTKSKRVFIAGLKDRQLADDLSVVLREDNIEVDLCVKYTSRNDYLKRLAAAEIAVLLPMVEEGFFLPAIESMILGSVAVVPDCVGSREFCIDDQTCLVPARTVGGLHSAVLALWKHAELRDRLRSAAFEISAVYTPENEMLAYHKAFNSYMRNFTDM